MHNIDFIPIIDDILLMKTKLLYYIILFNFSMQVILVSKFLLVHVKIVFFQHKSYQKNIKNLFFYEPN